MDDVRTAIEEHNTEFNVFAKMVLNKGYTAPNMT